LAGNVIPQAHPTGYPIYRLEWQKMGSLQRRLQSSTSSSNYTWRGALTG
jgi:sulfur-oxidizing protein SoxA